jgi:hypothetical protein
LKPPSPTGEPENLVLLRLCEIRDILGRHSDNFNEVITRLARLERKMAGTGATSPICTTIGSACRIGSTGSPSGWIGWNSGSASSKSRQAEWLAGNCGSMSIRSLRSMAIAG